MSLRENINKIHSDLTQQYSVQINEKFDNKLGEYIQLIIKNESNEIKLNITKRELENNKFNWVYFSNPILENSNLVQRLSTTDSFYSDIKDIFEKKRFSEDYLKNLD